MAPENPLDLATGKTGAAVFVTGDEQHELHLIFTDGTVLAGKVHGDCCSESWWADVFCAQQFIGGRVTEVVEIDLEPPNDDRSRQEYDRAYGYRVTTSRGVMTLAFRNSSNGYYGGGCSWEWGRLSKMVPVATDWSA